MDSQKYAAVKLRSSQILKIGSQIANCDLLIRTLYTFTSLAMPETPSIEVTVRAR